MAWRACYEARRDYYVLKIKHFPFTVPELHLHRSGVNQITGEWKHLLHALQQQLTIIFFIILNHSRKYLASLTTNTAWKVFLF